MKKLGLILTSILLVALVFTGCKKTNFSSSSIPSTFKVDIPSAISSSKTSKSLKSTKVGQVQGDDIYKQLRLFIAVGENAGDIVQSIMHAIGKYDLNKAQTFSYKSDEDGRTKNVKIEENVQFDNQTWMYELTTTDAQSEGDAVGGKALQVFWNNNPVKGIAILYPYNINREDSTDTWARGMFRIDYSEAGDYGYEQSMIVTISNLPTNDSDMYAMSSMKMFAGRNGDVVDVYGNSGHPNAHFFDSGKGFDWAFVASGNQNSDLAVAQVGLPPYTLDENSRDVLLNQYSIHNVFTKLISDWYLTNNGNTIDSLTLASYLANTQAPGFFNKDGFVAAGTAPTSDFNPLLSNINALSPYNPKYIADLSVKFK